MSKILAFTKHRNNSSRACETARAEAGVAGSNAHKENLQAAPRLVSVVVPTCGRPQLLSRCLAALILQRFDAFRFEIIVVDDAPDHRTREVVADWTAHAARNGLAISYLAADQGPHGPAAARNRGWRAARGAIIAFTDDDTVPRTDWLEKGLRAFDSALVQAVWGRIVMPLHHAPTDYELDAKGLERAEFATANCFCRKSALERLGGFDERFRVAWREDADLYFSLLDLHARVAHVPAAVVVHPIRPASWGVSLAQQRKVLFDALLFKKHPRLYREKIRAAPRWDYYAIVLALLVSILGWAFHAPIVAMAAGGIWLYLTARFCVLRLRRTVKTPAHIGEMIVTSVLIPPLAVFWRVIGAVRFRTRLV